MAAPARSQIEYLNIYLYTDCHKSGFGLLTTGYNHAYIFRRRNVDPMQQRIFIVIPKLKKWIQITHDQIFNSTFTTLDDKKLYLQLNNVNIPDISEPCTIYIRQCNEMDKKLILEDGTEGSCLNINVNDIKNFLEELVGEIHSDQIRELNRRTEYQQQLKMRQSLPPVPKKDIDVFDIKMSQLEKQVGIKRDATGRLMPATQKRGGKHTKTHKRGSKGSKSNKKSHKKHNKTNKKSHKKHNKTRRH